MKKALPPKKAAAPLDRRADKKKEMATYRDLDLDRLHKSKFGRNKVRAGGLYVYLGDGHADRPYLKVLRSDYLRIWEQVKEEWVAEAKALKISYATFDNLQRVKLENRVYDLLSQQSGDLSHLESSFLKTHGRRMSPQERSIYSKAQAKGPVKKPDPNKAAAATRRATLNELMHKIELKQKDEPGRLQQAWATVVGPEMSLETLLESVDREKGLAICRCLSSTRSFVLRRRKDLPAKLSEALGVRIDKVVFR